MPVVIHGTPEGPCSHPAHRGFGEAVDADFHAVTPISTLSNVPDLGFLSDILETRWASPPVDDVYILEYSRFVWTVPSIYKVNPDATIVLLMSNIQGVARPPAGEKSATGLIESIIRTSEREIGRSALHYYMRQNIDGYIAVSPMVRDYTAIEFESPVETARPYIQPSVYQSLDNITPNYNSKIAVTVGDPRIHKRVGKMAEQWSQVREEHPDAELWIVGEGHSRLYDDYTGVKKLGYVDDLAEVYQQASLYVHPAICDSSPVSTLEALLAGTPIAVTQTCGTKKEATEIAPWLVSNSIDKLPEVVNRYFDLDISEREDLGEKAHDLGKSFGSDRKEKFADAYNRLLESFN